MKPTRFHFTPPQRLSTLLLLLLLAFQPAAGVSAQPGMPLSGISQASPSSLSSTGLAGCQWTYYPIQGGKLQPEQLLYNDPDSTPITNLSLGNPFLGKTAQLARGGSADFNGDNKTDVFRTTPRPDGNLQWAYSSGGTGAWQNLAYATSDLPISQLLFGTFDSDARSDVFASLYDTGTASYQWQYSSGGTGGFSHLNSTAFSPSRLALGDFNGDGVTDVFTATSNAGTYQWKYSASGTGPQLSLAQAATDPSLLRFGDFNADGKTDVFAATQQANGSTQWMYSSGGAFSYFNLNPSNIPYSMLNFGDFNGDGKTDILTALPQGDGSLEVLVWSGGQGPALDFGRIPAPAPALRVGDFNGDGISDLMAYRCGMNGPIPFRPLQLMADSGFSTFNRSLAGDINGDGFPDLILVSTCQNPNSFGTCVSHHLLVSSALGTPSHSYSLVPPQQLGASNLDFQYFKTMTGDFNGDGKADLALIYPSGSTLTIYIALSNGDGTFSLGSAQTFGGESWGLFNPTVGDYNGDGKADLAFSTVCAISSESCSVGDNNSLYVATAGSGGVFTMSARQDLGPSGWTDFYAYAGDFNGDGKTDLVFNSTCQKKNFIDSTCTISDANYVYTALSNGNGSFTLGSLQTYGASGWGDYPQSIDLIGDVNGDGRSDIVWSSGYQAAAKTNNNLVVAGLANPDGTFGLGSSQNFGSAWSGRLLLANLNGDGKVDLVWNHSPLGDTDVDTYAAAASNGNGTFNSLGQGSVYTGQGYFSLPDTDAYGKVVSSLTILSTRQDPISNALIIVNSGTGGSYFLPFVKK